MLHTVQEAGAQNNDCSDLQTLKILGHLDIIVDVICAQGMKALRECICSPSELYRVGRDMVPR